MDNISYILPVTAEIGTIIDNCSLFQGAQLVRTLGLILCHIQMCGGENISVVNVVGEKCTCEFVL